MKFFIPFFLLLNFLGCAFDQSPTEINQRENKTIEEKNRVLRSNYGLVTGFYQGRLRLGTEERLVTLGIYTLEVKEGNNSSGEPIFKPVLKAVYRQIYPVEIPIVLDGRYVPETGELSFINTVSNQGMGMLHTISGSMNGTKILGEAKTPTGVLGNLELEFIQKKVDAPTEGDEDQTAQKLRQQYEGLTGTYVGTIKSPEASGVDNKSEWDIELGIYTLEIKAGTKPNGETLFRPVLKGVFKQLHPVVPSLVLDAQYIAETGQLLFLNPNAAPGELHTINASLTKQTIQGSVKRTTGTWGHTQLQFSTKNVNTDPSGEQEDYNRRLTEEYKVLVGNYTGTISPVGRDVASFTVEVKIFIIQEAGTNGLTPKLKAYYRRTSDRFNATDLTMNVEFKTELGPPGVDMSGQRTNGAMAYFVVLNGYFQNKEIRGQYHDQRGHEGPFRLKMVNARR